MCSELLRDSPSVRSIPVGWKGTHGQFVDDYLSRMAFLVQSTGTVSLGKVTNASWALLHNLWLIYLLTLDCDMPGGWLEHDSTLSINIDSFCLLIN